MNPGRLNRRIEIWKNILRESEETFCEEPVPAMLKKAWASITPKTGSLLYGREAGTMLSQTTHLITMRYSSVKNILFPECWLLYYDPGGTVHRYEIDYILDPYARHEYVEVFVREVV